MTGRGEELALQLSLAQTRRFERVIERVGAEGREPAIAFLLAMVDPPDRERVIELTGLKLPRVLA